jgi:hypothetical protein
MLRQSLDLESRSPMEIGVDAHRLWHAPHQLVNGSGNGLGTTIDKAPNAETGATENPGNQPD